MIVSAADALELVAGLVGAVFHGELREKWLATPELLALGEQLAALTNTVMNAFTTASPMLEECSQRSRPLLEPFLKGAAFVPGEGPWRAYMAVTTLVTIAFKNAINRVRREHDMETLVTANVAEDALKAFCAILERVHRADGSGVGDVDGVGGGNGVGGTFVAIGCRAEVVEKLRRLAKALEEEEGEEEERGEREGEKKEGGENGGWLQ